MAGQVVANKFIMQWRKKVALVVILFIAVIVALGYMLQPPHCFQLTDCSKCWAATEQYGSSQYCSSGSQCNIQPYIDQHNALVDVLTCACDKASANSYNDPDLNVKIRDLYRTVTSADSTVQDICKVDNAMLVKWYFE